MLCLNYYTYSGDVNGAFFLLIRKNHILVKIIHKYV